MKETKHIVCFSKGHSSALVAIEVAQKFGTKNLILVNHDINPSKEDADIKRFGSQVADFIGLPITYVNIDGITDAEKIPDQFDISLAKKGFKAPNTSDAFCTFKLKTEPFFAWLNENHKDQNCVVYYGFDANETARIVKKQGNMGKLGWQVDFPLAFWERTILSTKEIGIDPPLSYGAYKHANCKGCLKAGIIHWYVTYCNEYDIYCRAKETEKKLGYTIQKLTVNGVRGSYSLEQFERIFSRMKADGIPATEYYTGLRSALKKYGIEEANAHMPCECLI